MLNLALFLGYRFTTTASCVLITLVPTSVMGLLSSSAGEADYGDKTDDEEILRNVTSTFSDKIAAYAVLGTSSGKF